jgi:hypothetical protein
VSYHQGQTQPSSDDTRPVVVGVGNENAEGSAFADPAESSGPDFYDSIFGSTPYDRQTVSNSDLAMLTKCCLTDSTGQPVDLHGRPLTADLDFKGQFGFDSQFGQGVIRPLDLAGASVDQLAGLHRSFNGAKLADAMAYALSKVETISPEEQKSRIANAHQDCNSALGKILNGSANAADLGELLATYMSLNGFTQGSFAQGYVADAMNKVRMVLAAAAENRAHPSGLSYAEVLHRKLNKGQIQELAQQQTLT